MAHRAPKRPRVSVIMAIHDGASTFARAADSVLNQSCSGVELVVVDCASRDRTPSMLESYRDRDIRVESVTLDTDDVLVGFRRGLHEARGSYVMFMRQADWLAPDALSALVDSAEADELQMVFASRSEDVWDRRRESCRARLLDLDRHVWTSDDDIRHAVGTLYERGLFDTAAGVVVERELARQRPEVPSTVDQGFAFVLACLRDAVRMGTVDGPLYHAVVFETDGREPFDPDLAERCSYEHAQMMSLVAQWGMDTDPEVAAPIHRRHVRRLIECIDNASVGTSSSSSQERLARVQHMLDAADTRDSLAAVASDSREFGIMYKPMAQGNAQGCCFGARLRELARISHLPLGQLL